MIDQRRTNLFMIAFGIITILISIWMNKIASNYSYIITYMGIVFITIAMPDHKYLNWLKTLILIPAGIIGIIGPLAKILFEFIFAYFLPLGLIAIFYKFVPKYFFGIDVNYAAKVYLTLTTASIFITFWSEKLMIWCRRTMNGDNPEELLDLYKDLGHHLINRQRTRYLIFLAFFCYILVYSTASLNNIELFTVENTNVAVMQTFGTYIAFDRLISNKNLFHFSPKLFLAKILPIWGFDFSRTGKKEDGNKENDPPSDQTGI